MKGASIVTKPRFLIADDHDLFRDGLRYALVDGFAEPEISEAGSFDQALDTLGRHSDFVLASFDLMMPGMQDGHVLPMVRELYPSLPLVIISAFEDRQHVIAALDRGASGYIPKSLPAEEIVGAMRDVISGKIYVPASIVTLDRRNSLSSENELSSPRDRLGGEPVMDASSLTPRQRDVLDRLIAGRATKEIGRDLDLAEGTVKIHLAAIFRILGVRNRTEAVARALSLGLQKK